MSQRKKRSSRLLIGLAGSALALGLLMGQGCPTTTNPMTNGNGWNPMNGVFTPQSTGQPSNYWWGMMGGYGPGYGMMWNNGR